MNQPSDRIVLICIIGKGLSIATKHDIGRIQHDAETEAVRCDNQRLRGSVDDPGKGYLAYAPALNASGQS